MDLQGVDIRGYIRQERSIRNKALRQMLMRRDPHCHWCHCLIKEYPEFQKAHHRRQKAPDDMATLEHLLDRFDPRRYKDHNNRFKVLACYKCNTKRGLLHVKQMPKELIDRRRELLKTKPKGMPRPIWLLKNLGST